MAAKRKPIVKLMYDEYNKMFDNENNSEDDMLDAWDAYYNHRMECSDCGYR